MELNSVNFHIYVVFIDMHAHRSCIWRANNELLTDASFISRNDITVNINDHFDGLFILTVTIILYRLIMIRSLFEPIFVTIAALNYHVKHEDMQILQN